MKSEALIKKAFGPLHKLVNDPKVFELLIDGFDEIYYVERDGIKRATKIFKTAKEYETFVDNFIKTLSGKPGELSYYFSLSQTTKVNIVFLRCPLKLQR